MPTPEKLFAKIESTLGYVQKDIQSLKEEVKEDLGELKTHLTKLNGSIIDINEWKIRHSTQNKMVIRTVVLLGVPMCLYIGKQIIDHILA